MKIKCNRAKLWEAFQIAAPVAPSRSPKAILQNIKLEAADGRAVLSATDLEVGVRVTASDVEVQTPGSALLSVARFGGILRESSDVTLSLECDPQGTTVRGERSEFRLPGENAEDFPSVPEFAEKSYLEVPARLLREMIRRTIFATDPQSSRYALGGVLLEFGGDTLIVVGTDGRRLAKMEGPAVAVGGAGSSDQATIVPTRALQLIERSLSDSDAEVKISSTGNNVLVHSPRLTLQSRLVEGRFPKWRDVLPRRDGASRIELPVGPFHMAVRQAAIVTSEESRGVDFTFGDGAVVLAGHAGDVGQARVELPIAYDGPKISIMLDPRYLTDFLRVLDPEKTMQLDIKDSETAALCSTDDGYAYVIMPMARDR
jgi:DNA polymerase III subunit beta